MTELEALKILKEKQQAARLEPDKMKRLTKRVEEGNAVYYLYGFGAFDKLEALEECVDRLAAYEDTGLEPEEINEFLHQSYGPLHKKLGEWIAANQDGRLVVQPPNDPLTLEELREMDGEPVWISPAKENGKVPERWMLVSGYNPNKDIYLFAPSCNITQGYNGKSYGKTWIAYRRRPEEGTA